MGSPEGFCEEMERKWLWGSIRLWKTLGSSLWNRNINERQQSLGSIRKFGILCPGAKSWPVGT